MKTISAKTSYPSAEKATIEKTHEKPLSLSFFEGEKAFKTFKNYLANKKLTHDIPFLSPEWLKACDEITALNLIIIEDKNTQETLLFPFKKISHNGLILALPFGDHLAEYSDCFNTFKHASAQTLQMLLNHFYKSGIDAITLKNIKKKSALDKILCAHANSYTKNAKNAPIIELKAYKNFDEYFKSLNSKSRKSMRRNEKKLNQLSSFMLKTYKDHEETKQYVQQALEFKKSALKQKGITSKVFNNKATIKRFIKLSQQEKTGLITHVLENEKDILAIEIGYIRNKTYYSYLGAMSPDYLDYGVGNIQLKETIKWCFENKIEKIDLLPPDDHYKKTWAKQKTIETYNAYIPVTPLGWLYSIPYHGYIRPLILKLLGKTPKYIRHKLLTKTA